MSVMAIFEGKLWRVGDDLNLPLLIDDDTEETVTLDFGDERVIVDPTDQEIADRVVEARA